MYHPGSAAGSLRAWPNPQRRREIPSSAADRASEAIPPCLHRYRPNRARVIVADERPARTRHVIKDALQAAGATVVAEARTGREAIELVLHYRPDVVVIDVVMPELDGILATRQILKAIPDQLVIVLTGTDEDDGELGLSALRAGAAGFLSKDIDITALPRAIGGVGAGKLPSPGS